MNNEDVVLTAGVDVGTVKGVDSLVKQLHEAVNKGIVGGVEAAIKNAQTATEKMQHALARADGYKYEGLPPAKAQVKRLGHIINAQEKFLNEVPLSTATASYIAPVQRRLRANYQQFSRFVGESGEAGNGFPGGRLAIARRLEEINPAINRSRAADRIGDTISATETWLTMTQNMAQLGTTPQERLDNLKIGRAYMLRLRRQAKNAGIEDEPFLHSINGLLDVNKELIDTNKKQIKATEENTGGLFDIVDKYGTYIAAGAGGIAVGNFLSNTLAAYYGNRDAPYTQLRRTAADVAQNFGGAAGAVIGGIIGSLIMPGFGTVVGASIGGGIGSFAGGTWKRNIEAEESSGLDATDSARWEALYGGAGRGWMYGRFMEATGMAGPSDTAGLINSALTFGPAAAFGAISDQQWLALSMHPTYFSALQAGADEQTLLEAYRTDAERLGPGMSQFFVNSLPGMNENLRAAAMSGGIDMVVNDLYEAERMRRKLIELSPKFRQQQYDRIMKDRKARETSWNMAHNGEIYAWARKIGFRQPDWFGTGELTEPMGLKEVNKIWTREPYVKPEDESKYYPPSYGDARDAGTEAALTKRDLYIVIDGENKYVGPVYTQDQELESYIQFSAGSVL